MVVIKDFWVDPSEWVEMHLELNLVRVQEMDLAKLSRVT
jgi:hypothetical protein